VKEQDRRDKRRGKGKVSDRVGEGGRRMYEEMEGKEWIVGMEGKGGKGRMRGGGFDRKNYMSRSLLYSLYELTNVLASRVDPLGQKIGYKSSYSHCLVFT
jgi:hypothetical protein